jgi:hypothetical protein
MEYENALIKARQNNIDRYCRILATPLTDLERAFIHKRIAEERRELERLMAHHEQSSPDSDIIVAASELRRAGGGNHSQV